MLVSPHRFEPMTLGIEGERLILDLIRERQPPFSPDDVVTEFAKALKSYGLSAVRGDRYAGEWRRASAFQGTRD